MALPDVDRRELFNEIKSGTTYPHNEHWYRFDASGSVELLAAYVEDIETQVAKGIAEYKANTNTTVVKNFDEDSVVGLHKGLDDGTWHFPEVFEVYFPNLQGV